MSKTINTRIQNKYDTEANWNNVKDTFIPLSGELIVYEAEAGEAPKGKIGDGKKTLAELPFVGSYNNSTPMVSEHGGIPAGTIFNNVPIQDVLTMILYPYVDIEVSGVSTNASTGSYTIPNFPVLQSVSLTVKKNSATNLSFKLWDTTNNRQVGQTLTESNIVNNKLTFSNLNLTINTNRTFSIKYTYKGKGGADSGEKTTNVGTFTLTFVDPSTPTITTNLSSTGYYNGQTASVSQITANISALNSAPSIKKLELYKNNAIVGSAVTNPTLPYKFSVSDSVTSNTTYKVKAYYDKRTGTSTSTSETSVESSAYSISFTNRDAVISLLGISGGNYSKLSPKNISGLSASFTKHSDKITSVKLLEGSTLKETKTIAGHNGSTYSTTAGSTTFSYSKSNVCTTLTLKAEAYNENTKVASDTATLTFYAPYCYGFVDEKKTFNDIDLATLKTLTSSQSKKTNITLASEGYKKFVYAVPSGNFTSAKDGSNEENFGLFEKNTSGGYTKTITFDDGSTQIYQILILNEASAAAVNLTFS